MATPITVVQCSSRPVCLGSFVLSSAFIPSSTGALSWPRSLARPSSSPEHAKTNRSTSRLDTFRQSVFLKLLHSNCLDSSLRYRSPTTPGVLVQSVILSPSRHEALDFDFDASIHLNLLIGIESSRYKRSEWGEDPG